MKVKFLICALCMLPMAANAGIPYRAQQVHAPKQQRHDGHDNASMAREHRFYVGGAYNFAIWDNYTDKNNVHVDGKNTSSFELVAGVRPYDIFRLELNYINNKPQYNELTLKSQTIMMNALFDARIDNLYRPFYKQHIVPYVGLGAGASYNSSDSTEFDTKVTPTLAALAGIGFEMGEHMTIDFGYRYFYMFTPKFDVISNLAPMSHQFHIGIRVNF